MFEQDDILALLPAEMRKGDNFIKLSRALSNFYKWYESEIRDNSNYAILDQLEETRLEKYASRFGVVRGYRWYDDTYRRAIALSRKKYERDKNIIDNLYNLVTQSTNYGMEIDFNKYMDTEESGAITTRLNVPPFEPPDFIQNLKKYWVLGCRIDYDVFSELDLDMDTHEGNALYEHHKYVTKNNDWRG